MGFLTEGDTLRWEEAKKYAAYIREHGVAQFLSVYRKTKQRTNDALLWGDEVRLIPSRASAPSPDSHPRPNFSFFSALARLSIY